MFFWIPLGRRLYFCLKFTQNGLEIIVFEIFIAHFWTIFWNCLLIFAHFWQIIGIFQHIFSLFLIFRNKFLLHVKKWPWEQNLFYFLGNDTFFIIPLGIFLFNSLGNMTLFLPNIDSKWNKFVNSLRNKLHVKEWPWE